MRWVLSPLFLVKRMLHLRLGAPSDSYRNATSEILTRICCRHHFTFEICCRVISLLSLDGSEIGVVKVMFGVGHLIFSLPGVGVMPVLVLKSCSSV